MSSHRDHVRTALVLLAAASLVLGLGALPASSDEHVDVPPAVDPGEPTYSGLEDPVPPEPVGYEPAGSMLEAIHEADVAAGGESFWIDRVLERPSGLSGGNHLYTRGRALYMYNHTPGTLGFAGGYAYRERPTGGNQHLYTVAISDASLSEDTAQRRQYPSHWLSVHTDDDLRVEQRKLITHNNVAVTVLTLTNTGDDPATRTVSASSLRTDTTSDDGTERTGEVTTRYQVTTIFPRLSGDGMIADGSALTRDVTLDPGESVTLKVQMGVLADELPESVAEYERYRGYDPETAWRTHLEEYNRWWVDNVPYVDVPDANVKKMSYYRTFLNRFNLVDANVPGNDYQFPVSIEGVLGYNNAIQLTQPMHMQDLKYFRDPIYGYGNLLSSGETSKCGAFTDNPGSHSWGNTYEQYIAREGWEAFKVHGGDPGLVRNFAYYAECDVKGQLDKYDSAGNYLIEYPHGFLTGNDFDATPFVWAHPSQGNSANRQDRAESAFWYAGAKASAEAYGLLGEDDKAAELAELAGNMRDAILTLWDDRPADLSATAGLPPLRQCWPLNEPPLCEGQVFKHRLVNNPFAGALVPWKDQQNFAPFIERVPPTDDPKYREALRYYADAAKLPIMPFYTADQRDKAEAARIGRGGSNNFSNINSTLQAQVFSAAIRDYPSEHITPGSYLRLLQRLTWVQYVGGDNRYPNNNEYFFNWNANAQTFGRSGIHHNILGAFNFMLIDDVAGVRPRLDEVVELWPIDVGWEYFTVNNLRYHGRDVTVVWNKPGVAHYEGVPEGYSLYVDGQRAFTVDRLAHVTWDSATGEVAVLDGSGAAVLFAAASPVPEAVDVTLAGNARMVDMLQKAGRDITAETGWAPNLAEGRPVSASFTTSSPSLRVTASEHAVSGFTVSGLPSGAGGNNYGRSGFQATNTIWGTQGSPNAQDWFEVDLEEPARFDTVKLYFYSDKSYSPQQNSSGNGNTYRQPLAYTVQYHDGDDWVDVPGQVRTPDTPLPNYNQVGFPAVTAQRVRVLFTPTGSFGVGLKEIQVFDYRRPGLG